MTSLVASGTDATVYAVADIQADADAWIEAGADRVIVANVIPFGPKVNLAYRQIDDEPWVILVGDDVHFHPGWLTVALEVADAEDADVIAVNDWSNGRCKKGEHATHPLIRRTYIDEFGSSWDGPGVVCHEGYRHCYVDDEITAVAKQRGRFAGATESVVEHLHPVVGKAQTDDVYAMGWLAVHDDWRIFDKRRQRYGSDAP
jgi:hypothetical protein